MQLGQSVSPGGAQENPTWQFNPDTSPQAPQPQASEPLPPIPAPTPISPAPAAPAQTPTPAAPASQPQTDVEDSTFVSWTASEFIAHAKSAGWYGLLALGTVVFSAVIFLLTRDRISTGVIVIVAIIFGISAARKPRELQYEVNNNGIGIGDKPYPYSGFRSFALVQEGGVESIWFMPLKRFMPIISIYYDPADGDKILNILSQNLPFEDRGLDPVDRLMHRMRF